MTTEAKVGAFTLGALALLAFIVVHLSGFSFNQGKGYKIEVLFHQVNGLRPGGVVRYAGVDVGTVQDVRAEGLGARVFLDINRGITIPKNAVFAISSDGLMGEKFISITPAAEETAEFLEPGDVVNGRNGRGMDYMLSQAGVTLEELQKLVKSLNDILGNPAVKDSLTQSALNLKDFTGNLNQMTLVLQRMAVNNEQDLRSLVHNLNVMSSSLVSAADGVDQMIRDFSGSGQTADNLRQAVANLTSTSQRIENMAANLEPVVADPQTAADLKAILHNAKTVTGRASGMMEKVSSIKTEVGADYLYSGSKDRQMINADLKLYADPHEFLLLGVDDIGEGSKANIQVGSVNAAATYRAGIVDSKLGAGADLQTSAATKFSLDAYDPNDIRFKLRAQYEIAPNTYLLGQTNSINKKDERATYFGLRRTF